MGVLAQADLVAVDLDDQDALGRPNLEDDPATGPACRQVERPLVDPGRIQVGMFGACPANGIWTFV